jgi:NADH-quinone oxidoreductase subunit L
MGLEAYGEYSWLIPLMPLVGACIAGFFGARWLRGQSHWPIWLGVGFSALFSLGLLVQVISHAHEAHGGWGQAWDWFNWIEAGNFKAAAGAWIDPLTATMLMVVTGIGFLITVFAAGYMKGEEGYFRFFAYLGLFIFAMTCLVMANNFIMLYLGWEGVGLCSYLLIGYYYERPSAVEAAKKAFLVNRVGDFGFGIGIMLSFLAFGTVSYFGQGVGTNTGIIELAMNPQTPLQQWAVGLMPFCLMVGAFGKSAQFPLHVWLPDAMEGPTPVSALIHAATMVTAGVYMIARCGTIFVANESALWTVAFIGTFTAVFAGSIALRQFDLKKVFAYSTVSQLGFMFAAVGVLAAVPAVFHLVTHAFFKALLFLSSGVVMHAMMGELDLRKMSGLRSVLPKTRWLMLIGCAALAGVPFLSGFFSKDEIIGATWHHSKLLALVLLFTAFLTAYYSFRLYFRVFEGPLVVPPPPEDAHGHGHGHDDHGHGGHGGGGHGHGDAGHHDHEPSIMMFPLYVLAIGAIIAGYLNFPTPALGEFLGQSPSLVLTYKSVEKRMAHADAYAEPLGQTEAAEAREAEIKEHEHAVHVTFMVVSGIVALGGIWLAYYFHLKNRAAGDALPLKFPGVATALENKYWIDEIYQAAIVEPLRMLGHVCFWIDRIVVDGLVWAFGFVPQAGGFLIKVTTQRGYLQGYAAAMAFGIVVILLVVFW